MWYLRCLNDTFFYLHEKVTYTIGRKNTDITIEHDESISRNHATLKLKGNNLYLIDTGSKYGTFVGKEKLKPNEEYKISAFDLITFGLLNNNQSKFKVINVTFKVIFSNMSSDNKNSQIETINTLNIERIKVWDVSCTHIIASEAKLTSKMLCAIVTGQHIVNIQFFPNLLQAVKNKANLPKECDYKPDLKEILLNKNINLDYNPERRSLFQNLIFVFASRTAMNKFSDVIKLIGGTAMHCIAHNQYPMTELQVNSDRYVIINDCDDKDVPQSYKDAVQFFHSIGKRTIPSHEIPLAIVLNSKEENCNPSFNRANLLIREGSQTKLSEDIWAMDTQHSSNEKSQSHNTPNTENQDIVSVVEPTISTDTSIIKDTPGSKRSLEVDISSIDNNPSKKKKEDPLNTFPKVKQSRSTQSSLDKFSFDKNISKETQISETTGSTENPFSRKRKAANDLKPESKKRLLPLENISNLTTKAAEKPIKDTSSIVKLSTSWIKKDYRLNEIKQKNEEHQDTEIEKINEKFKDSITITFCSLAPRKQNISSQTKNPISVKNFKKFKKVHQTVQHQIIYDVCKIIVGDKSMCSSDKEENNDDDDDDDDDDIEFIGNFQSNTSINKALKPRRRFQFS